MNFRRITRGWSATSLVVALAAGTGAVALAGCGEGGGAHSANIKASDMPDGESWTGVYFHPVFGYLHMVENNNAVVGKWKRADQSKWGELDGTKVGNVMHYTWKEHTYGLVGPSAHTTGKGVFVYKVEESNGHKTAKLDGQWGLGGDEVGSSAIYVKQDRMEPKLDSINGDVGGTGAPPAAGKWDEK